VNKLDTLFNDTLTRILTKERLAYMVLKRLLEDHEIKLSKRQLTQMSADLVNSGTINIKIRKDQVRRAGFKNENAFEEYLRSVFDKLPAAIENFEERLNEIVEKATAKTIDNTCKLMVKAIKSQMKLGLGEKEAQRLAFEYNIYRRWGKALNALEMLILLSIECGGDFNNHFRAKARAANDLVFEVLTRLHARGCQVAYEIFTLLKAGYADGAHARWRCLHEIAVVAVFVKNSGHETAEAYLLHEKIDNYKEALSYNEHCAHLGYEPLSESDLKQIEDEKNYVMQKYGGGYYSMYGWALNSLKRRKADFVDIEKAVNLDHYRPLYKMACHNVHAGSKGSRFRLGLLNDDEILLAGPSNLGFYDPGVGAARSLNQLTVELMTHDPTFDSVVSAKVLNEFRFEIECQFGKADEKLQLEILNERQDENS
jgi:hypothetical protein